MFLREFFFKKWQIPFVPSFVNFLDLFEYSTYLEHVLYPLPYVHGSREQITLKKKKIEPLHPSQEINNS